jgi:ribonuclease R
MPLSSKRVIEAMRSVTSDNFDEKIVQSQLIAASRSNKKRKQFFSTKDIRTINTTFYILTSIGFIEYRNSRYSFSPQFTCTGEIIIRSGGKGEINNETYSIYFKKGTTLDAHNGDIVQYEIEDIRGGLIYGAVTKIIKRKKEFYFGKVDRKISGLIQFRLVDLPGEFYAVCKRFDNEPQTGALVKLELTGKLLHNKPACKVVGEAISDSENFDFERVCLKHNLPEQYTAQYDHLFSHTFIDERISGRADFTQMYTVTIDGKYAKDFDDAISLEVLDDEVILYVHIADVSEFVKPHDALDKEAFARGNSYYLANKVIPMLPEILSNQFCSLKQDELRLTMTAKMCFTKKMQLKKATFHTSFIRVDKRLTYDYADRLIDSLDENELATLIRDLFHYTTLLKKERLKAGRLDLELSDFELLFSNDGSFTDITVMKRLRSHEIVEESMLAANECVAAELKQKDIPSLYRVHEPISKDNWFKLKKLLSSLHIRLKGSNNPGVILQAIIDEHKETETAYVINILILRSMMQAYYGTEPVGHFGLGFDDYTHFTSPIRRYSDLIVHRVLKNHIQNKEKIYETKELSPIAQRCSERERIAQKAERELFKIKSCRLMEEYIGETFTAIISGMNKVGMFIAIQEKPIEGMIPFMRLGDDYYIVDEETMTVTGRRSHKKFTLGDRLTVELVRSDHLLEQIDFTIVE